MYTDDALTAYQIIPTWIMVNISCWKRGWGGGGGGGGGVEKKFTTVVIQNDVVTNIRHLPRLSYDFCRIPQ